tara:strand:+ start:20044 stop:20931 length:888 start_codon:yes stop_codon:yes gene_type:complete
MFSEYFKNEIIKISSNITIYTENDKSVKNFGKQWRDYTNVQIDSRNKFTLSYNFLKKILHQDFSILENKEILEIGCGAGRFTEHFAKFSKLCCSLDLSDAIFHNISKNKKNVKLAKANFLELEPKKKFDIVFCRGVLQHTPNPKKSILKLHEFVKDNGLVIFDIYKKPKIGIFHPKYLIWRPLISNLIKYEEFEIFLHKNIDILLKIKRFIDRIFFQVKFFSDCIIPIWDYKNIYQLNDKQLSSLSILDTLDGIYAKYDLPMSNKEVLKILKKNNIKIYKNDTYNNYFITKIGLD